jgi:hypothetical protein
VTAVNNSTKKSFMDSFSFGSLKSFASEADPSRHRTRPQE